LGSATAPTSPNALCFSDGLPSTGLPCHVEISADGLTVRFDEHNGLGEVNLPFRALSVGGAMGDGSLHADGLSQGPVSHQNLPVGGATGTDEGT
jgi:hypothetical protein